VDGALGRGQPNAAKKTMKSCIAFHANAFNWLTLRFKKEFEFPSEKLGAYSM
jgi:hypothetical protein